MALNKCEIDVIKATWAPAKKDPVYAGCLLFKRLFTKFPQYKTLFPQFADVDMEKMQENKRLVRHVTKVIEAVTFVVDSLGDESQAAKVNEVLGNLIEAHKKRKVGPSEFKNLGGVLVDFICELNQRKSTTEASEVASTTQIVSAWTKLYGVILDLVKEKFECSS